MTAPELPADEPEESKPVFDGFAAAVERLFRPKPDVDADYEAMRQRARDRAGDDPPMGWGRPRQ